MSDQPKKKEPTFITLSVGKRLCGVCAEILPADGSPSQICLDIPLVQLPVEDAERFLLAALDLVRENGKVNPTHADMIRGHHPACFKAQNDAATCGCGATAGPDGLKTRLNDLISLCCSVGGNMSKLIPWRGSVSDFFTDMKFVIPEGDMEAIGDKIRLRNWGK